jgi:inhibitor of KinA
MRVVDASDRSLLVVFGDEISLEAHQAVLRLTRRLTGTACVLNVHPAYASILVDFDPLLVTHQDMRRVVAENYEQAASETLPEPRLVEVPVCYGGEYGPDLLDVASANRLTADDVISIHSSAGYLVYFLGFSPGFPYLGGMAESIATPRLAVPRPSVAAGSVAIGGRQTGIYPLVSPGGWRIIGRTPLRLFQPEADPPVLLRMGDHVKFVPITRYDF